MERKTLVVLTAICTVFVVFGLFTNDSKVLQCCGSMLRPQQGGQNVTTVNDNATAREQHGLVKNTDVVQNNATFKAWPRFVITTGRGRLGNQMNIYAALLGIAAMNNMTPVFSGGDNPLKDTFRSLVALDNARTAKSKLSATVTVEEITYHIYDRRFEFLHTLPDKVIRIGGYLHSWRYYAHIASTIRRQFTFRDRYATAASRFLKNSAIKSGVVNTKSLLYIGVHIRRTDRLKGGDICGIDYLRKSVKYMIDRFRGHCLLFVVCSDDMKWARKKFPALLSSVSVNFNGTCKPTVTFSVNRDTAQDMAILASCDHIVITQGSFGYWSATLAGGVTVRCKKYPVPIETKLMTVPEDMYLASWIAL